MINKKIDIPIFTLKQLIIPILIVLVYFTFSNYNSSTYLKRQDKQYRQKYDSIEKSNIEIKKGLLILDEIIKKQDSISKNHEFNFKVLKQRIVVLKKIMKKLITILIVLMLSNWTVQSQKCYSNLEKKEISKRLNELIYYKKTNSNLNKQIFELRSTIISDDILINTIKQKVSELEKNNSNINIQKSILFNRLENQTEQTKIYKKKRVTLFLKGTLTGAVIVIIIKSIL